MNTIYQVGYVKSGNTWLTRLLGDVLNSPTGGSIPQEDRREVAAEGSNRTGKYFVRKGHYLPVDNETGDITPEAHRLAYKLLTRQDRLVFLVRDPRDICISGSHHWRVTPETFLDRMILGDVARLGRWDDYVKSWLEIIVNLLCGNQCPVSALTYEQLLKEKEARVLATLANLNIPDVPMKQIHDAYRRQSFEERKKQIQENGDTLRRNNLHIGKSGEWVKYFSGKMHDRIWSEFGEIMQRVGYKK